ncbi:MAG TPA: hypothetical protein VHL78_00640 [Actinomycetota bacterium]|nr:hypothetical protein [Actinomycetota bacterium]
MDGRSAERRSCPNCGADDWEVHERATTDRLAEWFRTGWRAPRREMRCRRCGEAVGTPLVTVRGRPGVIRHLRFAWPIKLAPWVHIAAASLGVVAGVVLDATVGWPWWAFPPVAVTATWLAFSVPALWRWTWRGPGGIGVHLLEALSPRRGWRREADLRRTFQRPPFPLYGLPPSWEGPRSAGGWGATMGRVNRITLVHGSEGQRGTLAVETWNALPDDALALVRGIAADELEGDRGAASDPSAGGGRWERTTLRVEGKALPFDLARRGDWWAAVGRVPTGVVVLQGHRFPLERLELVRVLDTTPYVEGRPPCAQD